MTSTADDIHLLVQGTDKGVWYNYRDPSSGNWNGGSMYKADIRLIRLLYLLSDLYVLSVHLHELAAVDMSFSQIKNDSLKIVRKRG